MHFLIGMFTFPHIITVKTKNNIIQIIWNLTPMHISCEFLCEQFEMVKLNISFEIMYQN